MRVEQAVVRSVALFIDSRADVGTSPSKDRIKG